MLQFIADIEVVGYGALAAAGHHGTGGHARLDRFFHAILHQRLVDDREHFLGHAFGGGKEAGTVARNGEKTFTDIHYNSV